MKPYIFYLLYFAIAFSSSYAQQPTRVSAIASDYTWVTCTHVLPGGRQYNAGYFSRTVDFDPDPNQEQLYSATGGGIGVNMDRDPFIQVLNWDGSLAWAWAFGTDGDDEIIDIEVDPYGNLYVAGNLSSWSWQDLDLAPGDDEFLIDDQTGAFLAKFSFEGKLEWANVAKAHRHHIGSKKSYSNSIELDPEGNLTWSGSFTGGGMDFTTPQGELIMMGSDTDPGGLWLKNGFLVNVRPNGEVNWAKDFGSGGDLKAARVAYDKTGNLFVGGAFSGNCDFDPSDGTINPNFSPLTSSDSYLMRLDPQGEFEWIRFIKSAQIDQINDLAVDQEGNVIVVGVYDGSIDLDPGPDPVMVANNYSGRLASYVVKLDGEGNYHWGRTIGHEGDNDVRIRNVEVDELGHVYFSAGQYRTTDIDMGPGVVLLEGLSGGLMEKLDSEGNLVWWEYFPRTYWIPHGLPALHVIGEDQFALGGRYATNHDSVPGTDSTYLPVSVQRAGFSLLWGIEPQAFDDNSGPHCVNREDGEGMQIFPNPNHGEFTLVVEGQHAKVFIEVFDSRGKKVLERDYITAWVRENGWAIPIEVNLQPGIYFLRYSSKGRCGTKRLLIR